MISYENLTRGLDETHLRAFIRSLEPVLAPILAKKHGDSPRWEHAVLDLAEINALEVELKEAFKLMGETDEIALKDALKRLMPWRKGPFTFAGVHIDTEWRSDFKWARVAPHIDLTQKSVLDVGSGNGYYGYRMLGAGAARVVGIDPNRLFLYQFLAAKTYLPEAPIWQLPLTLEDLPVDSETFDVTFSMGVLYHRRSPMDHFYDLKATLKPGGELVLETIVIDGDENTVLVPEDRYAQMRNVWFLPSVAALNRWLERCGFKEVRCVDLSVTTLDEQRTTEWMDYLSLPDFLDPNDRTKTIEGYPAPKRAVMIARKPK